MRYGAGVHRDRSGLFAYAVSYALDVGRSMYPNQLEMRCRHLRAGVSRQASCNAILKCSWSLPFDPTPVLSVVCSGHHSASPFWGSLLYLSFCLQIAWYRTTGTSPRLTLSHNFFTSPSLRGLQFINWAIQTSGSSDELDMAGRAREGVLFLLDGSVLRSRVSCGD
jgi:hypothetical protein